MKSRCRTFVYLCLKGLAIAALMAALPCSAAFGHEESPSTGADFEQLSHSEMAPDLPPLLVELVPPAASDQTQTGQAENDPSQPVHSQSDKNENEKEKDQQPKKKSTVNNDRMFFVMPNFLTVENETQVKSLTWKTKFSITAKGAFDPYEFVVVGILSGIRQAENSYPAFGQGFEGYAKRYGTAFADQVDGNIMVGAVFPTILRTDPRYFQLGQGRFAKRFGYAISRIFVTLKDSGGHTFNLSEFLGNGVAIGISNFYYPPADRGVGSSLSNWGTQLSIDAFGNELKEFWPDIHRRLPKKKHTQTQAE